MVDKMTTRTGQKGFLPGYASTIVNTECKQRYTMKLLPISGHDPNEIRKEERQDNTDMWAAVCKVHLSGAKARILCRVQVRHECAKTNPSERRYGTRELRRT